MSVAMAGPRGNGVFERTTRLRLRLIGLSWQVSAGASRVTSRLAWGEQAAEGVSDEGDAAHAAAQATLTALQELAGPTVPLRLVDQMEFSSVRGPIALAVVQGPSTETLTGAAMGRHQAEAAAKAVLDAVNRRWWAWMEPATGDINFEALTDRYSFRAERTGDSR
jgi:hypothetical protein